MTPDKILGFWLDETDSKQWYNSSKKLDSVILREFYPTWVSIMDGKFGMWLTYPSGSLAYILRFFKGFFVRLCCSCCSKTGYKA